MKKHEGFRVQNIAMIKNRAPFSDVAPIGRGMKVPEPGGFQCAFPGHKIKFNFDAFNFKGLFNNMVDETIVRQRFSRPGRVFPGSYLQCFRLKTKVQGA